MKRALALAAVATAAVLLLPGCGRHVLRQAGQAGAAPAATTAATPAAPPVTGSGTLTAVDAELTALDQSLSTVDAEVAQATQAADSDDDGAPAKVSTSVARAASPAPRTLASEKAVATARLDGRLRTLAALKTAIGAAAHLSGGHRSTLSGLVAADTSGLTALRTKVAGEQTVDAVRADGRSMVVDYRVYLLVVPKVRLTIASDAETAAIARLGEVHDTLAAAIDKARSQGKDVSAAQASLADLANQTAAAKAAIAGKADALLAVAPSSDASAMTAATGPVRAAVRAARQDLRKAVADARQIRRQLS